jgi:hypothetical protein
MLQGLLEKHTFQALLEKCATNRAYHREYQRTVEDCLALLFRGFPDGLLPALNPRLGVSGLVRRGQADGTDVRACAVQVAVLLVRKIIRAMSEQERKDLAQAFLTNDAGNPTYKGFKYMFRVVERLEVSPALVSYLNTEVAGQLRGMSQQAILGAWVEAQVGGVMGRLRARCLEEAEVNKDVWQ